MTTKTTNIKHNNVFLPLVACGDAGVALAGKNDCKIIEKQSYTVNFNLNTRSPNWVFWTLEEKHVVVPKNKVRQNRDRNCSFFAEHGFTQTVKAYAKDAIYDMGHNCPAQDRAYCSFKVFHETFSLVNITPQHPTVNRNVWLEFENWCREQCKQHQTLDILAGSEWLTVSQQPTIESPLCPPDFVWKCVVCHRKAKQPSTIKCIRVPNKEHIVAEKTWRDYEVPLTVLQEFNPTISWTRINFT